MIARPARDQLQRTDPQSCDNISHRKTEMAMATTTAAAASGKVDARVTATVEDGLPSFLHPVD